MDFDEWAEFGLKNRYHLMSRSELAKNASGFYNKGNNEGWLKDFLIEKITFSRMLKDQWHAYFCEEKFYERTREEFRQKARPGFYLKGCEQGWVDEIYPDKKFSIRSMTKEEWLDYGRSMNFDKLGRRELYKKHTYYYNIGTKNKRGWVRELIPKRKYKRIDFASMSQKKWLKYGYSREYEKLTRPELKEKDEEFYNRGIHNHWIESLIPQIGKKRNGFYKYMPDNHFFVYGIIKGYDLLTKQELRKKDNTYCKEASKRKLLAELIPELEKKPNGFFQNMTKTEWMNYGIERDYNHTKRSELKWIASRYLKIGYQRGWVDELVPRNYQRIKRRTNEQIRLDTLIQDAQATRIRLKNQIQGECPN